MNLILRTLMVTCRALWALWRGRPLGPADESVLPFRVWVNDLDTNLHMNNGRYLTIMDLGRLDFILRAGMWRFVRHERWMPLVGSIVIRFRRSLAPFATYRLHTRVRGWDDKWFYMEQRFQRGEQLVAVAVVRALFRAPGGNVPPAEALRKAGHPTESPPVDDVAGLFGIEDLAVTGADGNGPIRV